MHSSQRHKLSLIHPLLDHLLQQQDIGEWRTALVQSGVMTREEVIALDSNALQAAYKTLVTMKLLHQDADNILNEIERHQVSWKLDMGEDYRQGAICY